MAEKPGKPEDLRTLALGVLEVKAQNEGLETQLAAIRVQLKEKDEALSRIRTAFLRLEDFVKQATNTFRCEACGRYVPNAEAEKDTLYVQAYCPSCLENARYEGVRHMADKQGGRW